MVFQMSGDCPGCKKMLDRIMALELLVADKDMTRVREQRVIGKSGIARPSLLEVETYSDIHKTATEIVQEMALPISTRLKQLDDRNNAEFTEWKTVDKTLTGLYDNDIWRAQEDYKIEKARQNQIKITDAHRYEAMQEAHEKSQQQRQQEAELVAEFAAWKGQKDINANSEESTVNQINSRSRNCYELGVKTGLEAATC